MPMVSLRSAPTEKARPALARRTMTQIERSSANLLMLSVIAFAICTDNALSAPARCRVTIATAPCRSDETTGLSCRGPTVISSP